MTANPWTALRRRLQLLRVRRELQSIHRELSDPKTSPYRVERLQWRRVVLAERRAELRRD